MCSADCYFTAPVRRDKTFAGILHYEINKVNIECLELDQSINQSIHRPNQINNNRINQSINQSIELSNLQSIDDYTSTNVEMFTFRSDNLVCNQDAIIRFQSEYLIELKTETELHPGQLRY